MAAVESKLTMSTPSEEKQKLAGGEPTYASFTPPENTLPQQTSPLLSSTPPTVTKALRNAYPFILASDHALAVLTWTSSDPWKSFLLLVGWATVVIYFEILLRYFGHLLCVATIAGYVWARGHVQKSAREQPTLDAIVHTLNNVATRLDVFMAPITSLELNKDDISRLLFTTLFLTPIYMVLALFVFTPRALVLIGGLFVFTYHSMWARVTRAVLWRSRMVRLLTFYLTGIDFSGARHRSSSEAQLARSSIGVQSKDGKPVRFTYVLYENQRRWLGIGWTPNLLAYERAPWTDEFLNESSDPEEFQLPSSEGTGMVWRWVDKTWRLDLTNDGSLVPSTRKSKTTPDPGPNDGFIYYDNTWKKPSAEDSFTKYTRRRRWVRTAELTTADNAESVTADSSADTSIDSTADTTADSAESSGEKSNLRQRKSLRFE